MIQELKENENSIEIKIPYIQNSKYAKNKKNTIRVSYENGLVKLHFDKGRLFVSMPSSNTLLIQTEI